MDRNASLIFGGGLLLGATIVMYNLYHRVRTLEEKLEEKLKFANGSVNGTTSRTRTSSEQSNATMRYSKPASIMILRHGESEANVNHNLYSTKGDPNICLTEKGREQALDAGTKLATIIGNRPLYVFVSPYQRTRQTAQLVKSELVKAGVQIRQWREDPRIREREFCGTFQKEFVDRDDEEIYSRFFWRPPSGESCADVYDRVSLFMDTMWRTFGSNDMQDAFVLIISHGLTNRLFIMRWLHWTVEIFNQTKNPDNCSLLRLDRCAEKRPLLNTDKTHDDEGADEKTSVDDRHISSIYKLSEESYKILCLKQYENTSDANVLTQQLRLTAERYHLLYQEPMPMEQLVCNLCDLKQRYTQVGGYRPFGVSLLYMGWDHRLGFQLYQSDPSGNYSGWKATCIGNNSMAAISMLKQDYNEDGISLDEALKLAVKVLSKSLDLQSLTSEKVEIAHLTRKDDKTVIHILTSDEVDQLLKEHEEAEKKAEAEKLKAEKQKAAKK